MSSQPQQTPGDPEAVKRNGLFSARVINGSFIAGLVILTIIAVVLSAGGEAEVDDAAGQQAAASEFFWMVIGVLGVTTIAGAAILPVIFTKQARTAVSRADTEAGTNPTLWLGPWFTLQILRMTPMQGAGLFAAVAVLVSGDLLFLLPVAVFLAALFMVAPTRAKLDAFESLAENGPPHPTAM